MIEALVPERTSLSAGDETDLLVAKARTGDRAAFERLVVAQYDRIFRIAYRWAGNREDAEDVAQDVCIKLPGILTSFDGRSAFTSWLYRVVLNAVRDLQRKRQRHNRKKDALAEVADTDYAPDQERGLEAEAIWAAVRTLPPKQCDAVMLVYAQDMSHAEAAEVMGCKEATVSWHVHEAKKTLRGKL